MQHGPSVIRIIRMILKLTFFQDFQLSDLHRNRKFLQGLSKKVSDDMLRFPWIGGNSIRRRRHKLMENI